MSTPSAGPRRRAWLAAGAGALLAAGCSREAMQAIEGGYTGIAHERGHLLRQPWPDRAPDATRRVHTVIAGGGIAGLAAARALRLAGHEDFAVLELEDTAGGNSRGTQVGGIDCPMGAHYLPVPGDDARAVQDLLEELGLRRRVAGRWQIDERHLCHSPQERLFFDGHWQDGLLPVQGVGAGTLAQYRRFARAVARAQARAHYAVPIQKSSFAGVQLAQDAITFKAWLRAEGLDDAHLLWYLDYCCRDDYGAGIATVSAWAGLHYFASRHGFHAPGDAPGMGGEASAVFTWPQGNGWIGARLAAPLGDRLRTGRVVGRIAHGRHGVAVDAIDVANGRLERWQAPQAIVALPALAAARVVQPAPEALRQRAATIRTAPGWWPTCACACRWTTGPAPRRAGTTCCTAAPAWATSMHGTRACAPCPAPRC